MKKITLNENFVCLAGPEISQMFSGCGMLPCAEFEVCANDILNVN